nr:hypothetical protein Itr_chr05CG02700 [Ipomoea trifida]
MKHRNHSTVHKTAIAIPYPLNPPSAVTPRDTNSVSVGGREKPLKSFLPNSASAPF